MKIAVYSICANEEQHAERYMDSAKDADGVFILDTGSRDSSVPKLRALGANIAEMTFDPWRFDLARNAALALIPPEYDACIVLDLDETLASGWRPAVEREFAAGATRLQANYTFNFTADGKPDLVYFMDRAHLRRGYLWRGIVHEYLRWSGSGKENMKRVPDFEIHHRQDRGKSRAQYLPLLERACQEEPENDRNAHYLGREYWYAKKYPQAIAELQRHLNLKSAVWDKERSASMKYLGLCHEISGDNTNAERWLLRACAETPGSREAWHELAKFYLRKNKFPQAYSAAARCLSITGKEKIYLTTAEAWGAGPLDVAGTAAWYMGLKDEGKKLIAAALELAPDDKRIQNNFKLVAANG